VLSILGVGSAQPKNLIDAGIFAQHGLSGPEYGNGCIASHPDVSERRTVLPHSYILDSGNAEPKGSAGVMEFSPTDLAVVAVEQALSRAGIKAAQIGLVIGDCSTQLQTTPSEAQRVAGRLGHKLDAYDVLSSSGSMALHIELLSSWRPERVPEYVVTFSSNTPTAMIDYRSGVERLLFGDAAGALVLSKKHPGKLNVRECEYFTDVQHLDLFALNTGGHMRIAADAPAIVAERCATMIDRALRSIERDLQPPILITTCLGQSELISLARTFNIPEANVWSHFAAGGNTLGAAPICALAANWSAITPGTQIIVAIAGVGLSGGYMVLDAV